MIKQITKSSGAGALQITGYGAVGVWIEGVVHSKWPTIAGQPGILTMAFTAVAHGLQRAWYSWIDSIKAKADGESSG